MLLSDAPETFEQPLNIPLGVIEEIMVVDDRSYDNMADIGCSLGMYTIAYFENQCYQWQSKNMLS